MIAVCTLTNEVLCNVCVSQKAQTAAAASAAASAAKSRAVEQAEEDTAAASDATDQDWQGKEQQLRMLASR